jgi:hypothetical protein
MNRYDVLTRHQCIHFAVRRSFAAVGIFSALLIFATSASATLIGDSIEYDGHVKSGAATGVEQYKAAPAFPPITFSLPHVNAALTAPLSSNASKVLSGSETEFLDAFGGNNAQHVVITIQATNTTDNTFLNPLDPGIALPILFDGLFHTSVAGKKVDIVHVGIEDIPASDAPPFDAPGSTTITGLGTAANPLHVQLGISAAQVATNRGAIKVHLYYTTSTAPVPEPSTCVMLLTGVACLFGIRARRRG